MQRGESFIVGLADVGAVINQLTDDSVLTVKTGHVQRCVPKRVGLVDLWPQRRTRAVTTRWTNGLGHSSTGVSSPPPPG